MVSYLRTVLLGAGEIDADNGRCINYAVKDVATKYRVGVEIRQSYGARNIGGRRFVGRIGILCATRFGLGVFYVQSVPHGRADSC